MDDNAKPSVFGRSLQLVNGDLNFANGDFATITGRDNFLQAMQVMIETPFGTDIFNVNYGFDLMNCLSQPESPRLIKELIRLNIVKSLSSDARVREIKEIVFNDEPRFFEVSTPSASGAHPLKTDTQLLADESRRKSKASRCWQAMVIVQTISEGEVALKLEGTGA